MQCNQFREGVWNFPDLHLSIPQSLKVDCLYFSGLAKEPRLVIAEVQAVYYLFPIGNFNWFCNVNVISTQSNQTVHVSTHPTG